MNVQRTLETLSQRYSFVSPEGEMMEFMKRTLRGYFKQEMEDLFDEIMRGAYTYMAELVKQQPQNLNLLVDAMYYYFHLDFRVAYRHYVNLVSHYMNSQLDFCDRLAAEMLSCSIPQEVKHKIRSMSRSLGWFRKKDPNGSQFIMAEVANPEPIEHEEMRFMSDLFLLGDH
jgi:lysyl-tRNA synthetase class I